MANYIKISRTGHPSDTVSAVSDRGDVVSISDDRKWTIAVNFGGVVSMNYYREANVRLLYPVVGETWTITTAAGDVSEVCLLDRGTIHACDHAQWSETVRP